MVASEGKRRPRAGKPHRASAPSCQPPRTAHPSFHSHPRVGPTPICARRVTSTREPSPRAISAPRPPRNPKPAPSRRPAGRRRPDRRRGALGSPGPRAFRRRAPSPCIRPPWNNGRRGCGRSGGRRGARAPRRWKPRPSAGSLTARVGQRRLRPPLRAPHQAGPGPERCRRAAAAAAASSAERGRGQRPWRSPSTSRRYEPGKSGGLRPPRAHLRTLSAPQPVRA